MCVGFSAPSIAQSQPQLERPELKGVVFEKCCLDLLKEQDAKLKAAGWTKTILAWSPLLTLAGESNPLHAAYFIKATDWDELAHSITAVNKLALTTLATEALLHSQQDHTSTTAKPFWAAMSKFYIHQANEFDTHSPPSAVGTWVARNTQTGVAKTFRFLPNGSGTLSFNGNSFDVNWTQRGNKITIVHGSQSDDVSLDGNTFKTAVGIVYTRQ